MLISAPAITGPVFLRVPPIKSPLNVVVPVDVIVTSAISEPVPIAPTVTFPVPAVNVMFSDVVPITPPGSFIAPPTASSIVGPGAPAGTQAIFNPTTGAQGAVLPGTSIPAGFEAAPTQLSAGQMASNYFQNLKAGSVSEGLPTY